MIVPQIIKQAKPLKVFTTTQFRGHFPVPKAAVIIAENAERAARLLEADLYGRQLSQEIKPESLEEVSLINEEVIMLSDGEY